MNGYIYPMTKEEYKTLRGSIYWDYLKDQKWTPFSFEESSIDLTLQCEPRFVIDDVIYKPYKQYFVKDDDNNTSRLIVLIPADKSEQVGSGWDYTKSGTDESDADSEDGN